MSTREPIYARAGCTELRAIVQRAWPDVRVVRLLAQECLIRPGSPGADFSGTLAVSVTLSAPASVLIARGIVDQAEIDSLPPSGVRSQSRWTVRRGKATVSVRAYVEDPDNVKGNAGAASIRRLWGALTPVIASALWSPPLATARG